MACLTLPCLASPLSLSLLLNYLYPSSSLRSQTDSSLSSPSTITRLYLPSQELLQLQQNHANTLTPQTPITNQHHQHACLRVLLPVWRHDSHQHHLHCLRPQAMQQLPSVLKHSPTDTSRRHFPPLSSLLSHNTRLELYHDKGLQHGEMRVWIPSLIRDTTFLTTSTMALLFCSETASTPFTPMTWSSHSPFHLFLIDTSATGSSSNYPLSPTAKALLSASFGGVYAKAPRERYDVGFWAFYYSMLLRFGLVSGLTGNESQRIFSCNNN